MKFLRKFNSVASLEAAIQTVTNNFIGLAYDSNNNSVVYHKRIHPEILNNEIRYTSSDGNVVTPHSASFGTGITVVSNEYGENGGVIKLSGNATTIGGSAFNYCSGLTSITIPNSVTSIGDSAFSSCSGLTSITIPNNVTTIGQNAFGYCSGLTSVNLGSGVTSIGDYAFSYCSGLTSVTIPNSVTSIGSSAFYECTRLTSITIPDSVTSIGDYTFNSCYSLESITIPDSVTSIGSGAFAYCATGGGSGSGSGSGGTVTGLTSISIGSGVTSIGDNAFYECYALTSITCEATTPPTLGSSALSNTNDCPIYVPSGSVSTYKAASGWSEYESRIQAIS